VNDLRVIAVQLNALEGKGPGGMGAGREAALLAGGKGQHHDEVVKLMIKVWPRSALDIHDIAH
jgi:hypothetical protein